MRVVAEGVEREERMLLLSEMGCDYLLGFLLSRPVEPEEIRRLLEHRHPLLASARTVASD